MRKFLVVLDDTRECLNAMRFAAMRAANTHGGVEILSVIPPDEFNHWIGVGEVMRAEARERIEAHFNVFAKWMRDRQGIVQVVFDPDTGEHFERAGVAFELASGRRAFEDEHGEVTVRSTLEGTFLPLHELVEGVDEHISQVIARALSRERDDRYPDVEAFARDLLVDPPRLECAECGRELLFHGVV